VACSRLTPSGRARGRGCRQYNAPPALSAGGVSFQQIRCVLANLSFHFSFNATVDLATFLGAVVSNRTGLTVANRINTLAFYAVLVDQHFANSFSTTLGQTLVVLVGTDGVSVTFNNGAGLRVLLHEVSQVLDVAVAFFTDTGLVEVELHVQLDTNGFRSRLWLGIHDWCWCWLRSRLDLGNLTGAAAEVQTYTHACHPLAVAAVDVVHTINAGLSKQVLGEVVLQTSADVGESAVVTAATRLTNALVRHAGGQVRTQTYAWLAEVVNRVKRREATLDVLVGTTIDRVVGRHVVIFAIGQAQGNIIGQEIANAGAIELAFIFEVTGAVGEVMLAERLYFYGALPLGERANGAGSQNRANNNAQGVFSFHP